jgi:hypothetical protein
VKSSITQMANSYSEWPRVADPLRAEHESCPRGRLNEPLQRSQRYALKRNFEDKGVAGIKLYNGRELK